jgi:hypothetical protein
VAVDLAWGLDIVGQHAGGPRMTSSSIVAPVVDGDVVSAPSRCRRASRRHRLTFCPKTQRLAILAPFMTWLKCQSWSRRRIRPFVDVGRFVLEKGGWRLRLVVGVPSCVPFNERINH